MANGIVNLLPRKEAGKPRGVRIGVCNNTRKAITPDDALRPWEEIFQQGILAANFHIDMTIAKSRGATSLADAVDMIDCLQSISLGVKLGIAIHGFGSGALHDDMDRAALITGYQSRMTANELHNLLLRDGVRDLLPAR